MILITELGNRYCLTKVEILESFKLVTNNNNRQ